MKGTCWGVGCKKQGVASLLAWQQRYCFAPRRLKTVWRKEGERMPSSCLYLYIYRYTYTRTNTYKRVCVPLEQSGQVNLHTVHGAKRQTCLTAAVKTILQTFNNQTHSQYQPLYWESDGPAGLSEFKQAEPISYPSKTTQQQCLP